MKRILFFAAAIFAVQHSIAQKKDPAVYARMVNTEGLKKHLTIIAADDMEGRETGTAGQRKAAAYIEEQFKKIGLSKPQKLDGYQQFFPLYKDSVAQLELMVNGEKANIGSDFLVPISSNETAQTKASQIVFAGYGIEDAAYNDYAGLDVKGKWILLFMGEPKKEGKYFINADGKSSRWTSEGLSLKLDLAARKGAAGAFVINPSMETFSQRMIDANKKSNVYYPRDNAAMKKLSYAMFSHNYVRRIMGESFGESIKKAKAGEALAITPSATDISIVYNFNKIRETVNASNVLGVIEGTDKKDEYVFLTAHYDHLGIRDGKIYNGADDDGSGTVAVIQMAEAFMKAKKEGNGPRRTLVFMTVSGEEKGLWGSEYYSDNPVYPLDKTTVDLNTDMIGRVDTERKTADTLNYVYVVGHDKISSELPLVNEKANKDYTGLVLDYKFDDPEDPNRIYFRSDHYNFARKGVPVLFFYDGMLRADYHKPTDDIEFINWPLFEKRAQMIFYTAWEMANRNEMLVRDKPIPTATR